MPPRTPKNAAKPAVVVRKKPKKPEATPALSSAQKAAPVTPQLEAETRTTPIPQPTEPALPVADQAAPPASPSPPAPNRRQRDADARRALLAMFQGRWPAVFPRDFRQLKPLARRIHYDLPLPCQTPL